MFQRKKIMESKNIKIKHKEKILNKSITLLMKSPNFSKNTNNKKFYQFIPKTSYSMQTSERKQNKNTGHMITNNGTNHSRLYNLNLCRQNSQGSLCSLKREYHDSYLSDINHKYNQRLNMHLLSEIKSPKIIDYINNQRKKRRRNHNYSQNKNDRYYENKMNHNSSYYNKSTQNSSVFANRNKNLSQRDINIKLKLEEYYENSIIKGNKYQKNNNKIKFKDDELILNKKITGNNFRYDKNKCVIERKFYGEDKLNKVKNKNKEKENDIVITINKTLSGNGDNEYNKLFYHHSKANMKTNPKKQKLDLGNNDNNTESNHNLNNPNKKPKAYKNISINNLLNYKLSSSKMLNKSKTNSNFFNTYLEEINHTQTNNKSNYSKQIITTQNNNNYNDNKVTKNNRCNDIKFIFPSYFNKMDINECSQESTNLQGNTFSNKITINNSNIGTRKEKFINSFLDGPEDIHWRFVDLHRQRKMFYENMCNKNNENDGGIKNDIAKFSDFDKNEYSEYFDNFNENVPII